MNKLFFFAFLLPAIAHAQEDYSVSLLSDTVNQRYRYVKVYTVDDDDGVDTVQVNYFPNHWLDTIELLNYQTNQCDIQAERIRELRRLLVETIRERDFFISTIDTIYGPGTWDSIQHKRAYQAIQGSWRLVERGVNARPAEVTGYEIAVGAKDGTIVINPDLTVTVVDIYPFDLIFTQLVSGSYRAVRGQGANQRVFILRR